MSSRWPKNRIKFDVKPEQRVIDVLKAHGFKWDPIMVDWYAERSLESATVIDCIKAGDLDHVGERLAERQMEEDNGII